MMKAERLNEIKDEIKSLVNEARDIIRGTHIESLANSYWIPHILMELDEDHEWLGGSMCTMQETIDALADDIDEEEEDEDEY
jgi:hypothetical protein